MSIITKRYEYFYNIFTQQLILSTKFILLIENDIIIKPKLLDFITLLVRFLSVDNHCRRNTRLSGIELNQFTIGPTASKPLSEYFLEEYCEDGKSKTNIHV